MFSGISKLNKVVKINLKDNYTPSVAAARKIPPALHDKMKAELNRMENMGVITKVEQPTEWISNIVVIDNPNKLRICIEPRLLNEIIKIPNYPIPSADRLMTNLQGSKQLIIADTLSRAQLNENIFNDDNVYESPADLCVLATAITTRWEELAKLTKDYRELDDVVYHKKWMA
ncbi:hypothetical protein AVEN_203268-1 [Araneus ventricosus]|uniref:Uncharacterized protein n=1 Tax=Araneus ventricosus TaxID=182803 RepID=A0A4Y2WC19_ARAVE|nr:hypothetical protein AVEN_203268-1 [Araneus ventricosus]